MKTLQASEVRSGSIVMLADTPTAVVNTEVMESDKSIRITYDRGDDAPYKEIYSPNYPFQVLEEADLQAHNTRLEEEFGYFLELEKPHGECRFCGHPLSPEGHCPHHG